MPDPWGIVSALLLSLLLSQPPSLSFLSPFLCFFFFFFGGGDDVDYKNYGSSQKKIKQLY